MSSTNDAIKQAITHVTGILDHLNQGEDISLQEYTRVIDDLEILCEIKESKSLEEQIKMNTNIDDILLQFNKRADDSKELLQNMLSVVTEGRVPDESDVIRLNNSIDSLREDYNKVYSMAMSELPEDEMLEEGLSAVEYAEAIKNSKSLAYKRQLESMKVVLKQFISVQSLVSQFTDALLPYKQEAHQLMKDIAGEDQNTEELVERVEGPTIFLKYLNFEGKHTDEGRNLLDQVIKRFSSPWVAVGLSQGGYFIPESALEENVDNVDDIDSNDKSESGQASKDNVLIEQLDKKVDNIEDEYIADLAESIEVGTEYSCLEDEKDSIEGIHTEKMADLSAFSQKVCDAGILIEDVSEVGLLSCDKNDNENKKVSASIFQNDVKKGNTSAVEWVIQEIAKSTYITLEQLVELSEIPEPKASAAIDYLQRKGYLRKYKLIPGGEFYCASPRLMKALTYKNAAKSVGVRQKNIETWGESIDDKNTSVASRIVGRRLYYTCAKRIKEEGINKYSTKRSDLTDAFYLRVCPSDSPAESDICFAAFWDSTDECDAFLERVKDDLKEITNIERAFFASLNKEKAKALADVMLDEIQNSLDIKSKYLYSLSDEAFYTYPDCVETEPNKAMNDDEETPIDEPYMEDVSQNVKEENVGVSEEDGNEEEKTVEATLYDEYVETEKEILLEEVAQEENITKPQNGIPIYNQANKKEILLGLNSVDEKEVVDKIVLLINMEKYYAATAYAKAVSMRYSDALFYNQLAHALNDPMGHCNYSTSNAFTLIKERGDLEDAIVISTALRTFFSNQVKYDYNIKSYYSGIKEYGLLREYPALSQVLYTLMEFKDTYDKGIDAYAEYHSKNKSVLEQRMRELQHEASVFYDNVVAGHKKETASQKRFLETKKLIFSAKSEIGVLIKAIVDEDASYQPLAREFLQENFYKEDSTIEETTIDSDRLWQYIMVYWNKAGEHMMYQRRADLMSHLRSNIIKTTTKSVQLLARWCVLVDRLNIQTEDGGNAGYKKIRMPLIENVSSAISEMEISLLDTEAEPKRKAGIRIVLYTLREIRDCLKGTYDENTNKYYYVPFMLTDDLMLDEDYLPDLDMHSSTMEALYPMNRIIEHVDKVQAGKYTFEMRLTDILDNKGDDYGVAKLIVDYLSLKGRNEELEERSIQIETGEGFAKGTADNRKEDFIGNLELAQSFGQIDNSVEDRKDRILQIIENWYEWACESSNYGFFNRVMNAYLEEIREKAKSRETDLLEQLRIYKETSIAGLSPEEKEKRIVKIQTMIKEQNYTVAEDLLARTDTNETSRDDLLEKDYLKEFLENYEDYYQPVATRNSSFSALVSSRTRNKEQRGAKRLADNWLPGGSLLGLNKLENLLNCLGFKVASIKQQVSIGKYENYFVLTEKAKAGQRDNYPHPIAAFGSGAAQVGFRVVCVNGAYDTEGLIEIMKKIGNAKHTMILYDNALSRSERRRLARKTKNVLGDKLFVVVDRTVMMFLVRNYDETMINRMLVSLTTPFGYYQPYVWESVNVMPPEIFMGRKNELETIKSATGVNIVYGGRQLGKSALLKKAKEDIDGDENGNRAVFVDIKGLDYKKAAIKIGHALHDESILDKDIETEDWDELARAVKLRLQSEKNRIPYLLLLLDEGDVFIESCSYVNYHPFDALKDIQGIGTGRFKFVIAGLRNIVRFKREALGNNSVLTHLQTMTVKPFDTAEARELMEVPLYYLGMRFPKEKEYLITLILATTNYFPGLIQMYCAKLINAMRKKDYASYDEVNTPIYEVSEKHIKKVLADPEFTQQIREKFLITLKLDEDNYYYLIALLMAYLYHDKGYSEGYSAADIKNVCNELQIAKIDNLEISKLEALMEELRELNVLRNTDETHYLFTRFTFFQMMGTRSEVDDKLEEYMVE